MPEVPQIPLDNQQVTLYNDLSIVNNYDFDPGVCILPLAEDPPTNPEELATWSPVVTLRLHAPYRIRKVQYNLNKQNNPPVIPSPVDVGNFVFVSGSIMVSNGQNTSNCNYDWTVISNYIYVEDCASRIQDGLVLGSPPYTRNTTIENANNSGIAQRGIFVGAATEAGYEVLVGINQSNLVNLANQDGWGYNSPAYLPGKFFDSYLINGGYPPGSP